MTSKLGTKPPSNYPDSHRHMRGYIPATEYATAYISNHSQNILPGSVLPLLGHLNCEHFSHPGGRAPTLLSLKQHTQALTVLIRHLSISTSMGEIDAAHKDGEARAFEEGEAFDWLNDLETAYTNTDPSHNLPLTTLMNQVERQTDVDGPQFHCPLKELVQEDPAGDTDKHRPYSSHHNLLMHASECLEVLDHEYGATGGIMSLLPTDEKEAGAGAGAENVDMLSARNSLVGQWLLFMQHLVGRMHELETSYGQSLDALAGEAVVPAQLAARAGPSGAGRQVVFPQDKWVLANAGDDVFDHVHRLLDVQEGQHGERERMWRAAGVSGQRMWTEEGGGGGEEFSRGIVAVDLVTRYYRLKGSGKSTVFVLPAWQVHPRCKSTAEVEKQPTVVAVPAPLWPTRVSDWEARNRKKLEEGEAMGAELATVTARVGQQSRQIEFLMDELRKTRNMVDHYEGAFPGNLRSTVEGLEIKLDRYRVALATLRDMLPMEHRSLLDELDLEKTG
ncbi:uncharacterized protein DNG_08520 [Cephalotrichum gorgonifer]|uniref:Uncharacterized protein n=1 Tax=Cephalotrichum gorgonifer TaxID=2041049 RepID=A0AAE8SYJ7_9PEZI|nr:uncharacterized protein DNG_08520 [Cephalotrichum gorgonifer]